jgi:hypothetical protein
MTDSESIFQTATLEELPEIRKRMGYPAFYDSFFEYDRKQYNSYLNNYKQDTGYKSKIETMIWDEEGQSLKKELTKYICERMNIDIVDCSGDWELDYKCIKEFIYFKTSPTFYVENELQFDPIDYNDVVTLNGDKYQYQYFIWRRLGDPNIRRADKNEIVTRENFKNYARFDTVGWSVKQLRTFFTTNILPILLQKCNITINTNLPTYKQIINNISIKRSLNALIDEYIKTDTIFIDLDKVEKIKIQINRLSDNLEDVSLYNITRNMGWHFGLYNFIAELLKQQVIVKQSLEKKIINIRTNIENTKGIKTKYKWQKMCQKLTKWDIEQLRELAAIENIDNYTMKSKRELCKEFEEILQKKLAEQRRNRIRYIPEIEPPKDTKDKQLNEIFERHIQNNLTPNEKKHKQRYPEQYSQKCQNNDSILGDDLTDIKPEFFFTYKHNNKIFCDDIRTLYDQVIKRKDIKNPYDRTPLSPEVIKSIENTYKKLNDTMVSLKDDQVDDERIPLESILTSKTTDLLGLLFHHAPMENFLQSDKDIFREFVMHLEDEHILSNREAEYILGLPNLQAQKIGLVDLLTIKIRNDPNVVDGFSSMASNITDVYNSIFTDQLDSSPQNTSQPMWGYENTSQSNEQNQESENMLIQRKAIIFVSKLTNVPGINNLNIIRTGSAKILEFILHLIDANVLEVSLLDEWVQSDLLSQEADAIETNLTKLKIELLQKLINIIQDTPNTAETISNIIRTHNIFN